MTAINDYYGCESGSRIAVTYFVLHTKTSTVKRLLINFRGEKLIVTKKEESSRNYFKCMGWLFTMILLGGAIAVAVLIGGNDDKFIDGISDDLGHVSVGVIDTTPRKIKEGRRISTKSELNELDSTKLLEVRDPNAPNVLTNDPNFFNDNNPPKNAGTQKSFRNKQESTIHFIFSAKCF